MMPYWAEKVGTPRTLAVEFPFTQTLGQPNDPKQQARVINQALSVLQDVHEPGAVVHSNEEWPIPTEIAQKSWQPSEPSPIVRKMAPQIRTMLRQRRKKIK